MRGRAAPACGFYFFTYTHLAGNDNDDITYSLGNLAACQWNMPKTSVGLVTTYGIPICVKLNAGRGDSLRLGQGSAHFPCSSIRLGAHFRPNRST